MQYLFDITAFLVSIAIFYTASMWILLWRSKFPVPIWDMARIFAIAFSVQFLIYSIFSFVLIDPQLRAYVVRASVIVICMSQAIPLTFAFQAWKHESRSP